MKKAVLDIRELNRNIHHVDIIWLYMKHKEEESNYDFRWAIGYRKKDNWWGIIALFPATIESKIDEIPYELKLAKEAIAILKEKSLASKIISE